MNKPSTIGQRVKQERVKLDMTQNNLASVAGLAPESVCRIEADNRVPGVGTLRRLADALGVTIPFLIDGPSVRQSNRNKPKNRKVRTNGKSH